MFINTGYECQECQSGLHEDQFDAADACECLPKRAAVRLVHRCGNCKKRYLRHRAAEAQVCCTGLSLTWDGELIQSTRAVEVSNA